MKNERNILVAFILNLAFSVFELVGGIFTGSVAIISDAVHDAGDAASIGISYLLERKSRRQPDEKYTYGYVRYSVIGGLITTLVLIVGSALMICNAVRRIISPADINYNGMIIFAVVGVCVNFCAALFTRKGDSINRKAVNLHMLEDVLGWAVVLVGAVVMRFTGFALLDPIMSVGVSLFILINAARNLKEITNLFLEKVPDGVSVAEIKEHITQLDGVLDVHHIHVRSIDGHTCFASMHVVTDSEPAQIKAAIRSELTEHGITHATLELETSSEHCSEKQCRIETEQHAHSHHHHSH